MKKLVHDNQRKRRVMSFTIIPSTTNRIIQFSIPYWILITFPILVLSIALYSANVTREYIASLESLTSTQNQVATLENVNTSQSYEIIQLRQRSQEIEEQLQELNQLQSKVLTMVGLSADETVGNENTTTPTILASRSSWRTPLFSLLGTGGSSGGDNTAIDLTQLIETQKDNMEKLVVDVEKQLEYIDALPNLMPTTGRLTSPFGYRISPINRRREMHSGIDLANSTGTEIYASGSGIVTFSGYNGSYGRMIIISHGHGYTSVYAHNSSLLVKVGEKVSKGQLIAKMGSSGRSTGTHLHFEIRVNGTSVDPYTILEQK